MFIDSGPFWFLMGILTTIVAAGFRAFAGRRGWVLTWWKWALAAAWYVLFSLSFLTWGTLIGEGEGRAGLRLALLGLFVCIALGVGLWRLLGRSPGRPRAA